MSLMYYLTNETMPGTVPILRLPDEEASVNTNLSPSPTPRSQRSNSLAASLHANFINLGTSNSNVVGSARRRLSNVSDAVTRKLSRWRVSAISTELIVSQGTMICTSYIKNRLKRSGIFHRKLGFKRVRRLNPTYDVISDVTHILIELGIELEKVNPNLFIGVARQIGYGFFSTEQSVVEGLTAISRGMFTQGDISWMKIVSFLAVSGGISVDCARQGHHDYIPVIQKVMVAVLEEDVAPWIQMNGGWETVIFRYRPPTESTQSFGIITIWILVITIILGIFSMLIRYVLH